MTPVNYEFQKLKRVSVFLGIHLEITLAKDCWSHPVQACTATSSGNDRYSPLSRHHTRATLKKGWRQQNQMCMQLWPRTTRRYSRSSNGKATCVVYYFFPATKNVQQLHGFPTHVSHKATNRMALPWLSGSWGSFTLPNRPHVDHHDHDSLSQSGRQVVTKQSLATSTTKLVLTQSPPFAEACTTSRFHQHLEKICLRLHRHQNMARRRITWSL